MEELPDKRNEDENMKHYHSGPKVRYRTRKGNIRYRQRPLHKVTFKGKQYNIYKSNRKNKEFVAEGPGIKNSVHFADPNMTEFPGTQRGNNYCARSEGIGKRDKTLTDVTSPNFWSRKLWSCKGNKSISSKRFE